MFDFNAEEREIFLYDVVHPLAISTGHMREALTAIGDNRITLYINSPGGHVDKGMAIYQMLKRHRSGIDVVVDSIAASISSVIALAGETRTTVTGGRWMIHSAIGHFSGTAKEIREYADVVDKYTDAIIDIYEEAMSVPRDEIRAMMDEERYFSAAESLDVGLSTTASDNPATQTPRP